MLNRLLWFLLVIGWVGNGLSAAARYKFRVAFADKGMTSFTLDRPEEYLSERALERRHKQGLAVDSTDLPVCAVYVEQVVARGGRPLCTSKWNNSLLVETDDSLFADRLQQLPCVKKVRRVWVDCPEAVVPRNRRRKQEVTHQWKRTEDAYGAAAAQIRLHRGDSLHAAGFRGEGMQVAVIDAGFHNVDAMKVFKGMHLLGTRDFVNPSSDIYAEHSHGRKVLSCLAACREYGMVGTAPAASYWLLRSEDYDTEQPVEEDYWAAAVEFADSAGVDVVNTSLGYYAFDDEKDNYRYRDLDGRTSVMSVAAAMAAEKGMLVVVSAGNSGTDSWKKITPPADADHVLTVGAVDRQGLNADFSSVGNTADGRVKPDVMAVGEGAAVIGEDGGPELANGTSFAAPVFCGLATCLWQACPWLTVKQLIEVVHRAGDRADEPDNIYGYGIVDVWKAYRIGQTYQPEKR